MKRYFIVPSTVDFTQFHGEYHYIDLATVGTGAGAGYYAMVLVDSHMPAPAEAVVAFPHLLDPSCTLADASAPSTDVTLGKAQQVMTKLADLGLQPTHTPFKAACLLGAIHAAFHP